MSAGVKPDGFQPGDSGDEPHSADPGSAGNPEATEHRLVQMRCDL